MKTLILFLSAFVTFSAHADDLPGNCDFYFKTQNTCATLGWLRDPEQGDDGSFRLYFWDKDQGAAQRPVFVDPTAATIVAKVWNPRSGNVSSIIPLTRGTEDDGTASEGVFDAFDVHFSNSGVWEILVQFKDAQGKVTDSAKIDYRAP